MINATVKSYKSDNRGSAIITGLVVSTVLMVLCLSLLLISYSLFIATAKSTSDLPNREMLYSAAEALEHELLDFTVQYEDDLLLTDLNGHDFWQYINNTMWQGFELAPGTENFYTQNVNNSNWPYYNPLDTSGYHNNLDSCSKFFNLTSIGNVKIVVQFYWELPKEFDGDITKNDYKNGTLLNAVYRMYDNKGTLLVKTERTYKFSCALGTSSSGSGSGSSGSGSIGGNSFIPLDPDDHSVHTISPENNSGLVIKFKRTSNGRSELIVYNDSNVKVNNWKLYFYANDNVLADMTEYIIDLGNGIYAIQNQNWDAEIEPHESKTVGFHNDFTFLPRALVVEDLMQPISSASYEWNIVTENYSKNLVITNKSGKTIKAWNLEFDCTGTIYSIGKVVQPLPQTGHFVLVPADYQGAKEIENNHSVYLPLNVGADFSTIENVVFKTFSLTALEDLNLIGVNTMNYKWTRIGEDIINPGGGN
jgi:hypothetical protein